MSINNHPEDARLTSGKNVSYWTDTAIRAEHRPLKEDLNTDVVVIGGGMAGVSVAYCLVRSGQKVVLVEDGFIGSGETGKTTAQLVTALDTRYCDLERTFGEEKTKLIAESHRAAIDFVEDTVRKENIECGFERLNGYLFRHPSDKPNALEEELEAAIRAGVEIKEVNEAPGMLRTEKALCFLNQAQFHPLKYLNGLCDAIKEMGGMLFTGTHAVKIDHEGITTRDGFRVKARHVVVATNNPVNNLFTMTEKQHPYRTYVAGALIKKGVLPKALWWDTGDSETNAKNPPYHYIRLHPYNQQYDLLLCGGEDHPTGDTSKTKVTEEKRYHLIEDWARSYFPIEEIVYRWSGQVLEPIDGIAFIGRNPLDHKNVYIVTGDSGNGMTNCAIAGLLISDQINEKTNEWEKVYRPLGFTLKESIPVFKEIIQKIGSYLTHTPDLKNSEPLSSIQKGEGRVVDLLDEKIGAYRDENGQLTIVSATCTHLGCTVAWNSDELSWDCPCHGSRFTYEGRVMNGPANSDLPCFSETAVSQEMDLMEKNEIPNI